MSEAETPQTAPAAEPTPVAGPPPLSAWRKYGVILPMGLLLSAMLALLGLDTRIGHRLIADLIAGIELDNGLRIEVGRIEGSIWDRVRFEGVVLRDPHGAFLRVGEVGLEWRPLNWFSQGLDIRQLVFRRGGLARLPQFRETPPSSPWPDFDIRIDRLAIEKLSIAKPVLGSERRLDLSAQARLTKGAARLSMQGRTTGGDRLTALFDAAEASDRFDLAVDYVAPKGGLLAALSGTADDRRLRIAGKGTWHDWRGSLNADQHGRRMAALTLSHQGEKLGLAGLVSTNPLLSGGGQAALGPQVSVLACGTLVGKVLNGRASLSSRKLAVLAEGGVDLGGGAFDKLTVSVAGRQPVPAGADDVFDGLKAKLGYVASTRHWQSRDTGFETMVAHGLATRKGLEWRIPLAVEAAAIVTGDPFLDRELRQVRGKGLLRLEGSRLSGDGVTLDVAHAHARAALRLDFARGSYHVAGPLAVKGWGFDLGPLDGQAAVVVTFERGHPWHAEANITSGALHAGNAGVESFAGESVALRGRLELGQGRRFVLSDAHATSDLLRMNLAMHRGADGHLMLDADGQQARWGAFTTALSFGEFGPSGQVHFPDPIPSAGVRDLTLALEAGADQMRIDAAGQSLLGPFAGVLGYHDSVGSVPARLEVKRLNLSDTTVAGALDLAPGGTSGVLTLSGGGVSGAIRLAPQDGGQGVDVAISARNAHFAAARPITIGSAQLNLLGMVHKHHSTLSGKLEALGVGEGRLFVARLGATAALADGKGRIAATIGGRRGSRFDLQVLGDVAPDQLAVMLGGSFAGQAISMPRRAVFTAENAPDGVNLGWRLAPAELNFGGGRVVASGLVGDATTQLKVSLADMPLVLADLVIPDLGLSGKASGELSYAREREKLPAGEASLQLRGLSRSGLSLSSRPVDMGLSAKLDAHSFELRGVASEAGQTRGRLQARISAMPDAGLLPERLRAGRLFAQMRYAGPADALWRLMALDSFDLTGPVEVAADIGGTLDTPEIVGSLAGQELRLQSAVAGTDVTHISAHGAFAGGTLTLSGLQGRTGATGQISGSGRIDFSGMEGGRGPGIDLTLAARKAQLIARSDMALTATGPLRILSDGQTGTIAGRLNVDSARWRLGQAPAAALLPDIRTREINHRADFTPAERQMPWRLLVDASGKGIKLQGLGLDSQWNANVALRGTLDEPAIRGSADMVQGIYEFAGMHFDLSRGRILFDGSSPPDPRLDMAANADVQGMAATVTVRGTALRPEIAFSSVPAMPEEELLSRILFGSSVTEISAPEAVQLGAALASLHGGAGLDPINKLRSAIGLDRLRVVDADPTQNRQTGVAVGKYFGRRFYAEIVSDGRGYSATNLEFRIFSWLALLGSVASTGRESVNAKFSRDY